MEKSLSAGTINTYISSIRFFFIHMLGKEWDKKKIRGCKYTPDDWLFTGQNPADHVNVKTIKNTLIKPG